MKNSELPGGFSKVLQPFNAFLPMLVLGLGLATVKLYVVVKMAVWNRP